MTFTFHVVNNIERAKEDDFCHLCEHMKNTFVRVYKEWTALDEKHTFDIRVCRSCSNIIHELFNSRDESVTVDTIEENAK